MDRIYFEVKVVMRGRVWMVGGLGIVRRGLEWLGCGNAADADVGHLTFNDLHRLKGWSFWD